MSDNTDTIRALALTMLMLGSVFAGSVALSGAAAAASNTTIIADNNDAGASNVTYTADGNMELNNQKTLNYVDIHIGPADVSNVGEADVDIFIDGTEYTDGLTEFSSTSGTVEFKLANSRSLSDNDPVRVVVSNVTNPADDFEANVTFHDTGDVEFQSYQDTVSIDTPSSITYSGLTFDDNRTAGNDTTINTGENLTVSATVDNSGEQNGTYNASLKIDNTIQRYQNGTLDGGANTTVSFVTNFSATGTRDVAINDLAADEVTVTGPLAITGGSAEPETVTAGSTVSNQRVYVTLANVSQDGDTDTHYVEFPDALAGNISLNSASANATSITSSANLVDGYDNDGITETAKFATSGDGGGDIDLNLTVDANIDYPDTATSYAIDARTEDSDGEISSQTGVVSISTEDAPDITDYTVTNPSGRDVNVSFNASRQLSNIAVDITNSSGGTVATLTEGGFTETNESGTWVYETTKTLDQDGDYTATLQTAADSNGADGASGQSGSVTINTVTASIVDGAADPSQVPPGTTVNNQQVVVTLSGVSADGDTDKHFVEFPNALADGLSVNYASVNGSASIAQSAQLVEGFDNDGTDDTVRFQTDTDAGGTVPMTVTVDISVDYPDTATSYAIDARVADSDGDTDQQSGVTTIDVGDTATPIITNYEVTNPAENDLSVSFDTDEELTNVTVNITDSSDTTVATLTEANVTETNESGTWNYQTNYTVTGDGTYTATLTEATDADDNEGASGESGTVTVESTPAAIVGGSATPSEVTPGSTVNNQQVHVRLSDVSADGDTDTHYVEFPDALAGNLSVNSVSANATSITSSPNLVEGYDDDLVTETVKFATSSDAGGDIDLNLTVDIAVSSYPSGESAYTVDTRLVDSKTGSLSQSDVATIEAVTSDGGGGDDDGGDTGGGGDAGGGGGGGGGAPIVPEPTPAVTAIDLNADGQDVDVVVKTDTPVDALQVGVSGAAPVELSRSDFETDEQDGTYVHTADVSTDVSGSFRASVERLANDGSAGTAGQTAAVSVPLPDSIEPSAAAAPTFVDASDSTHTFRLPVGSNASVAGETLSTVRIQYSEQFLDTSGAISSVSDDQNVVTLQVQNADGTVRSRMGGTDAVSVNVADGVISLDLSDVDSSRKPVLTSGDRVVVRLRPVTNPQEAGTYETRVSLLSTLGFETTESTDLQIRDQSAVGAVDTEYAGATDQQTTHDLSRSETVESVTVDSEADASGAVRVTVPEETPAVASSLSEPVITTMDINRPDAAEDDPATITASVEADEFQADASALTIAHYDEASEEWTQLETSVIKEGNETVTIEATTPETSTFAILSASNEQQSGDDQSSTGIEDIAPGVGIGIGLLAAVGAAVLLLRRRR